MEFARTIWAGIGFECMYTAADFTQEETTLAHGTEAFPIPEDPVWSPGEHALGTDRHSSTDSYIYP